MWVLVMGTLASQGDRLWPALLPGPSGVGDASGRLQGPLLWTLPL